VRITEVTVVLHDRRSPTLDVFGVPDGRLPMGVLSIRTDEGLEGNNFLSGPGPGAETLARQIVSVLGPLLVGREPLDNGILWQLMQSRNRFVDQIAIGAVDVALWDLAGKAAGLPVHRLLGTYRDRIPAYFSSGHHARPEDYADEALHWREQGWKGYKVHPARAWHEGPAIPVAADIEVCRAVREAVGADMALMLDSTWGYSYTEALEVGRAIQELDFHWYEDPLPANDLHGYVRLKQHLHIPMLATEMTPGGLQALPVWLTERATDFLRGDVVVKGGITGLMKIAHLAEAFCMNCEVHDSYNAMSNVGGLHVCMAIPNCEWFEVLAFNRAGQHGLEHLNYGLAAPFQIDDEGFVHAPSGPGLGVAVDWELIESAKLGEVR
jgi:L-alanine-DL-glutamate epimerase-like enolase superfamily enzyme